MTSLLRPSAGPDDGARRVGRPAVSSVRPERVLPWGVATALWAVLGAAVVTGALVVGLAFPEYLLIAIVGVMAMIVCVKWPFAFAMVTLVVVLTAYVIEGVLGSAGGPADELVIVVSFLVFTARRILVDRAIVIPPGTLWFAAFGVLGVISSVVADVPTTIWLQAGFLALKGVLLAFAFAQLSWTPERIRFLTRMGAWAAVVLIAAGLVNLAAPMVWSQLVGSAPTAPVFGIRPLSGIFAHPAAYSRICAVIAVGILAYRFVIARSWVSAILLGAISLMALLSFRVKTIVGLFATFGVMLLRFARPSVVVTIGVLLPIGLLVLAPPIWWLISSDLDDYVFNESARQSLTLGGFQVAGDHFPFGAGFGRYGSFLAAQFYSPEYRTLGWTNRFGLGEGELGQFLMDTQWPAIIGEAGWFGAIAFAAGVVAMLVSLLRKTSADESPWVRWVRIAGIGWMVLLLIESLAAPVFVSPPSYPFMFLAAAIIAAVRFDGRPRPFGPAGRFGEARVTVP